jgi:thiamine-phosphate diphosphorylase
VTRLPPLLVLTDRVAAAARGRTLPETVAAAVAAGARAVVFREKDLSRADRRSLGAAVAAVMPPDGCLIVASDARLATQLGAAGVHLAADDPRPEPAPTTVGRSCHDRAELQAATVDGVDYVTVSPVYPTPSKPGYGPALGEAALRRLIAIPDAPTVYALGGVDAARAPECLAAGAAGAAVLGAVMAAEDPAIVVTALLAALDVTSGVKEVRG